MKLVRGSLSGEYSSPKTILGFFALVVGIVAAAVVGGVAVLATDAALHHLIVPVLIFFGVLVVAVLIAVLSIALRDPTKLQLGEVSAREFIEYQRLTLGDSMAGESVENVPVVRSPASAASVESAAGRALPPPVNEQERS